MWPLQIALISRDQQEECHAARVKWHAARARKGARLRRLTLVTLSGALRPGILVPALVDDADVVLERAPPADPSGRAERRERRDLEDEHERPAVRVESGLVHPREPVERVEQDSGQVQPEVNRRPALAERAHRDAEIVDEPCGP